MIHVTLNSSHIGEPNQAPEHKPASSQVLVDLGTRMSHASMAMAFFISYLTSESEYWRMVHVYSGYVLAGVLTFRLIWGWLGPASARWGLLLRRVAMWRVWWNKFKQDEWHTRQFWIVFSSWLLAFAVLNIYVFSTFAIVSGWATHNEVFGLGWLNDALQEVHEFLGNTTMTLVCIHVGLVVALRVWRGPNALRPMWRGRGNA